MHWSSDLWMQQVPGCLLSSLVTTCPAECLVPGSLALDGPGVSSSSVRGSLCPGMESTSVLVADDPGAPTESRDDWCLDSKTLAIQAAESLIRMEGDGGLSVHPRLRCPEADVPLHQQGQTLEQGNSRPCCEKLQGMGVKALAQAASVPGLTCLPHSPCCSHWTGLSASVGWPLLSWHHCTSTLHPCLAGQLVLPSQSLVSLCHSTESEWMCTRQSSGAP